MFSWLPVKRLSTQMTSSPRSRKLAQRWEPIKPAPPVIRILAISPPDRVVDEPQPSQLRGLVNVAPVEDHRIFHELFHIDEVRPAKLIPFRNHPPRPRPPSPPPRCPILRPP